MTCDVEKIALVIVEYVETPVGYSTSIGDERKQGGTNTPKLNIMTRIANICS
jgi:hypothetical protein